MKESRYFTPEWASSLLVARYFPDLSRSDFVVEPSAGRGSFLKAIPPDVPAIGVEIDERLAEEARRSSGRPVIAGDFLTVDLPDAPSIILGNPPFALSIVEDFLRRSYDVLRDRGKVGFILPAYAFQTYGRVNRWASLWSIRQEFLPRRIFPSLRLPIAFVTFEKEKKTTLVGFALYREAGDLERTEAKYRLLFVEGRPSSSVWRAVVEEAIRDAGGEATVREMYAIVEGRRPTRTAFWREQIRKVARRDFDRTARGTYRLRSSKGKVYNGLQL